MSRDAEFKILNNISILFKNMKHGYIINNEYYNFFELKKHRELYKEINKIRNINEILKSKVCACLEAVLIVRHILKKGDFKYRLNSKHNHIFLIWNNYWCIEYTINSELRYYLINEFYNYNNYSIDETILFDKDINNIKYRTDVFYE